MKQIAEASRAKFSDAASIGHPDYHRTHKRPSISGTTRFKAVAQSHRDGLATAIGRRGRQESNIVNVENSTNVAAGNAREGIRTPKDCSTRS